jgi:hypothetical protein
MSMESGPAQPQPQGVPVDHPDRPVADHRMAYEHAKDHPVRQASAGQVEARVQEEATFLGFIDRDAETRWLIADPDRLSPGHLDER